jgi:two-component system NtrC family sensor kinase
MSTPNLAAAKPRDKVLIVDDDAEIRELLRDQVLDSHRFDVYEAEDGASGLEKVRSVKPDMIILDLIMPGLSGNDFLVALKQQGFIGPVIVSTKKGSEMSAIDAFRLGAVDFFTKPIREAEVLRVIEQNLGEIQLRRERRDLLDQLKASNNQLESRLKELTTLSQIGRNVTTVFDLDTLFNRILEAACFMTESDHASLILLDEFTGKLILRQGRNLSLVMQEKVGEPINDDLAGLVMRSGEVFSAAGDGLKRFKVAGDLHATIYAPLLLKEKTIGILTVGNHKKRRAFDEHLNKVMGILADYGAIAIANARLFNALEQRARSMERAYEELKSQNAHRERLIGGVLSLRQPLLNLQTEMRNLLQGKTGALNLKDHVSNLEKTVSSLLNAVDQLRK